ncbi:MAG: PTS sugar transporter subunit IIA [Kiritimatiellaeota bacterium]|nr:PTS sugar transporter subunit IIA [Kiritimatiellota bacterium]
MNLNKVLTPATIVMGLKSTTKIAVIEEMVDTLVAAGLIKDRQAALQAIIERERKMSTGMQNGLAIPHGKTNAVDNLVALVGLKPEGLDFESLDGQPAHIFVMTLSPESRTGPHIQFLAEVSRQLSDPQIRERLLHAATAVEVIQLLTGDE